MNNRYKKILSLFVFGLLSGTLLCGSSTSWTGRFMRRCMPKHRLALLAGFGGASVSSFRSYYDKQKLHYKETMGQTAAVDALALCEQQQHEEVLFQEIKHKLRSMPFDAFTIKDLGEINQWIMEHKDHPHVKTIVSSIILLNTVRVCSVYFCRAMKKNNIELVIRSKLQKYYEMKLSSIEKGDLLIDDKEYDTYQQIHKVFMQVQKKEQIDNQLAIVNIYNFAYLYDIASSILDFDNKLVKFYQNVNVLYNIVKLILNYCTTNAFVFVHIPNQIHVALCGRYQGYEELLFFVLYHELEHVYQLLEYPHALHIKTRTQRENAADAAACEKMDCSDCLEDAAWECIETHAPPYFSTEDDFFPYWKDLILQRKFCDKHFAEELFCVDNRKPLIHEYSYEWIDKNVDRPDLPELLGKQDAELRKEFSRRLTKIIGLKNRHNVRI